MDTEQRERIKDFEERQNRKEKRNKFGKIVFGDPNGLEVYDFLGVFALPVFFVRVIVGLIVWLFVISIINSIKKAAKRKK